MLCSLLTSVLLFIYYFLILLIKWVCWEYMPQECMSCYIYHLYLLLHPADTHRSQSPTIELSQRNVRCPPVMNCLLSLITHIDLLLCCFDPIEDPQKFLSVIPPSHTVVTPINANNTPRGGILTNLRISDRCQKDMNNMPHSWFLTVKVITGMTDRLMAQFYFFPPMPA